LSETIPHPILYFIYHKSNLNQNGSGTLQKLRKQVAKKKTVFISEMTTQISFITVEMRKITANTGFM